MILNIALYLKNPNWCDPMLVTGPSGCGKTYSIKTIMDAVGIPFARMEVPELTGAGYKGINLQEALDAEVGGAVKRLGGIPERMILQVDEFDKIVRKGDSFTQMLQDEFLPMLERSMSLTQSDAVSRHAGKVEFDALVILSGAFSFADYDPAKGISDQTLKESGFTNEIIGRITARVPLRALDVDDYAKMLTLPAPDIEKKLNAMHELGIDICFDEDAIRHLAESAHESGFGARSLSSLVNETLARIQMNAVFGNMKDQPGITVEKENGTLKLRVRKEAIPAKPAVQKLKMGFGTK
jgi:ATP-dependent Clp protease ATP-binding subunit ClpX